MATPLAAGALPVVQGFFHEGTNNAAFVVHDPQTKKAAIIDPVWDFNPVSACFSTEALDEILEYVSREGLEVVWLLDTHAHADHHTACGVLRSKLKAPYGIGKEIVQVQQTFKALFNLTDDEFKADGSQFDKLFVDNEEFDLGTIKCTVMHTPGHTPACCCYVIGSCVFGGDTIFMPDMGSARCDFPGGSAESLWTSVARVLSLPEEYKLFVNHDYAPGDRGFEWATTIGESKRHNKHMKEGTQKDEFVQWRKERDSTLTPPKLILACLQVNIRAGALPSAESNGISYLKVPINALK